MNTAKMENGGPAFPSTLTDDTLHVPGMILRDYFAAQAMLGCIAGQYNSSPREKVEIAYKIADMMLEERAK